MPRLCPESGAHDAKALNFEPRYHESIRAKIDAQMTYVQMNREARSSLPSTVWNKIEAPWDATAGGYAEVSTGSGHIQAVGWDGSGCPVARTPLPYSQSSNPNSPHYSDRTWLYPREKWVTSRFRERDILGSPKLKVVRVSQ